MPAAFSMMMPLFSGFFLTVWARSYRYLPWVARRAFRWASSRTSLSASSIWSSSNSTSVSSKGTLVVRFARVAANLSTNPLVTGFLVTVFPSKSNLANAHVRCQLNSNRSRKEKSSNWRWLWAGPLRQQTICFWNRSQWSKGGVWRSLVRVTRFRTYCRSISLVELQDDIECGCELISFSVTRAYRTKNRVWGKISA